MNTKLPVKTIQKVHEYKKFMGSLKRRTNFIPYKVRKIRKRKISIKESIKTYYKMRDKSHSDPTQSVPTKINLKPSRHITIKLAKILDKILKKQQEKSKDFHKREPF